jgi:hypothetical protein
MEEERKPQEKSDMGDEGSGTGLGRLVSIAILSPIAALAFWFCMEQIASAVREAPTSQVHPESFTAVNA